MASVDKNHLLEPPSWFPLEGSGGVLDDKSDKLLPFGFEMKAGFECKVCPYVNSGHGVLT